MAQALRGMALVIGNSDYESLSPLANPASDARAVEAMLADLGFETELSTDRDARRLARDLDTFLEDAEGVDVAVLYYAGHGIEAGGENYLVPVDADLAALDDAGERLVPISAFLDKLRTIVPLSILLIDACRDNPFPPGALVHLDGRSEPVAMGAAGLGETRGVTPLGSGGSTGASLGAVIGFAAEPGRAALDGEPGGHSPYAAALIRHIAAMAGEEFGTVMRMVGEEVYLKTNGRQRPWVNESLRRLIYFGEAPEPLSGEAGEILSERRQLLLTIASLPDFDRAQVERVARDGAVPMDALFGMLAALGEDAPQDPAKLEELLRGQTERLKEMLAERAAIESPDPEIVRLSALADQAIAEGALATAIRLHDRAKLRFRELQPTLEAEQATLDRRFIEGAAVFARSAEAHALAFDHLNAAADYAEAFRLVERRDPQLAWRYKNAEMLRLTDRGDYKGDNAALERAIEAGMQALRIAEANGNRADWAATQNGLGTVYRTLGQRDPRPEHLEQAAAAFRAALTVFSRERAPQKWAMTQNNLGNALMMLGEYESGTGYLEEAISALRAALEERTREHVPLAWALTQNNLGAALHLLGLRTSDATLLKQAAAAYRAALSVLSRENKPLEWAAAQSNLGSILTVETSEPRAEQLEEAVAASRAALQEYGRARVPLDWARVQNNLGNALARLGEHESGTRRLEEAVSSFRAALEEYTRDRTPLQWATIQYNLGLALETIGRREKNVQRFEEAVAAYQGALQEYTRDHTPLQWADTQYELGVVLAALGERDQGTERSSQAATAFRAALEVYTWNRHPQIWANVQNRLGHALRDLGKQESSIERLQEAVAAYGAALKVRTRDRAPITWAVTRYHFGNALVELDALKGDSIDIRIGRNTIASSWEVYRNAGGTRNDAMFREGLAEADAILAKWE